MEQELSSKQLTPLMQQYMNVKREYHDALVLFQVGDFYELFFEDAQRAASFLGIALTKRGAIQGEPIPLCGVPVHALDHYLVKLVKGGFNVAICDQLEPAVPGKVVERGVTRVLTPGTLTDDKLLDAKTASYLFAFFPAKDHWGLVFGELLTAQLFATTIPLQSHKMLESELVRFFPDEIIVPEHNSEYKSYFKQLGYCTTEVPVVHDYDAESGAARGWMNRQFKKETIALLNQYDGMRHALYTFYGYLKKNQDQSLEQFQTINFYKPEDFLILDPSTQRNLELVKSYDGSRAHTLFEYMDRAVTSMGSRTIKKWILRPLVKQESIEQRYDVIHYCINNIAMMQHLVSLLRSVGDVERIVGRIALKRASVHDYLNLGQTLQVVPEVKQALLNSSGISLLSMIASKITDFSQLTQLISEAINDDSSYEYIIKKGYNKNLDLLRELIHNSQSKILELEQQEQQKTGIQSLKIRFNNVHGYYIEVTKANFHLVPDYYIRQQTLVGRERFTTQELKNLQAEIVAAQTQVGAVETELFENIKAQIFTQVSLLRQLAHALAYLDALLSLSTLAYEYALVRPEFNTHRDIKIVQGKHPVVARLLKQRFIANDTELTDEQSLWIITGPNMGGKSTYLRQVALICIMAQCGSFVPAKSASLPMLDRIFTRIGAGDNLAQGKSTFLMEMEETALICTQATQNSLLILDEVGRGTSTYDGLALAQAIVEYIYVHVKARCLFATHYHELTSLHESYAGIVAYHAASKKMNDEILFLYNIMQGAADGSFGIDVAKLAGLPVPIITRAQEVLTSFTNKPIMQSTDNAQMHMMINALQRELRDNIQVLDAIKDINLEDLTPRAAFDLLWKLKSDIK